MVKETGRTPSAIGRPSRPADAVQAADRDERGAGICRCQFIPTPLGWKVQWRWVAFNSAESARRASSAFATPLPGRWLIAPSITCARLVPASSYKGAASANNPQGLPAPSSILS